MASVASSLIGGSKKTTNTVDYKKLVRDAEAAGFNPLTALRNGGAAGFTTTSTPALSGIADALGTAGNFLANFDPMADDRREQEYELVQAQIANLNASTAATNRSQSFSVPTYTAGQREQRPSGQAAQLSARGPGQGENGEVLPMFVDWKDRHGNVVSLPNADLPDLDQMAVPTFGRVENATVQPIEKKINDDGLIKSRPLSDAEKKQMEGSWYPDWAPRLWFKWD